jgi:hypothetical protein
VSTLEGHQIRQWVEKAPADRRDALIGLQADDGKNEWRVIGAADAYLQMRQVASDGETLLDKEKKVPFGALDAYAFWHPAGDERVADQILASRSAFEVRRDRVHQYLSGRGLPAGATLSVDDEAELASLLRKLQTAPDASKIREQDVWRIAAICDGTPSLALAGARWIQDFIARCVPTSPLAIQCRVQTATLHRRAGRPKDALAATEPFVKHRTSWQLTAPTSAMICLIRASAMMDIYENNSLALDAPTLLYRANVLLKRAYKLNKGGGVLQEQAFWRHRTLVKSRPPTTEKR